MMEVGLPEYETYDIYDFKQATTSPTNIKEDLVTPDPFWLNDDFLVGLNKVANLANFDKIAISNRKAVTLAGFEVLKKLNDVASAKNLNDLTATINLAISADRSYAAYIQNVSGVNHLFVIAKEAKALDEAVDFGPLHAEVEGMAPALSWSNNNRYLIVGDNEVFDAWQRIAILPYENDAYRRRLTYLSPDQTKALVISIFQDRTGQGDYSHETIRIFIKDLASGQEINIISFESPARTNFYAVDGSFSPDENYVTFSKDQQLWLAEVKTGKFRQLTIEAKDYASPRFSPDGSKILYVLPSREVRLMTLDWQ